MPLAWGRDQTGADGVENDVTGELEQVGLSLDDDGLEAPLEEVPAAAMAAVEAERVDAVWATDAAREVRPWCSSRRW